MVTKKYDNGLTVTVEEIKGLRSVTAGIMVGAGSAYETAETNGISHFIEHTQFKGTKSRTAEDIVREFDETGAAYNAYTSKEYTCYYFKSIDEKTEKCFEVLSDLFLNSTFEKDQLDRERGVIIGEINMSKDEPDGVCYDVLYRHMFSGSMGLDILGPRENVARFEKPDIEKYKKVCYVPSNIVIAFVGNITAERACALTEKYMRSLVLAQKCPAPSYDMQEFNHGYAEFVHDYEQSEISIAYPALCLGDERAVTLSALDCLLGNGMSSRLFQRIREKEGLCYSVYTSPWLGKRNGVFSVCANVSVLNAKRAVQAIKDEIEKLVKLGVCEAEVQKAKTQIKTTAIFGKENPMSFMQAMLRRRILLDSDYDLDDLLRRIDAVTVEGVNDLAREIFKNKAAMAYVGKAIKSPLYDIISD